MLIKRWWEGGRREGLRLREVEDLDHFMAVPPARQLWMRGTPGNALDRALLRSGDQTDHRSAVSGRGKLCLGSKFCDDPQPGAQGVLVEHVLQSAMYTIHAVYTLTHVCACVVQAEIWDAVSQAALNYKTFAAALHCPILPMFSSMMFVMRKVYK